MTSERLIAPDLRCLTCGDTRIDVTDAETHNTTQCLTCGALAAPADVRTYTTLLNAGHVRPARPDLSKEARHDD